MSWLIPFILAGAIFTGDSGSSPIQLNYGKADESVGKIVRQEETERFEQTYPLSANGRVGVSNVNGSITIETWDNNQVKLEAVKFAANRERLADVGIKVDAKPDSLRVESDYDKLRQKNNERGRQNDNLRVEYHLIVPRNAVLDEIETVNGTIAISNAANITKASAVNGEVRATNLRGTANLSTVNGTVLADFDQLQMGSKISLNTVNGQVELLVPSDANATVKADTLNGNITNDFGLPVRKGQYVGRNLYGKIGSGDVQIWLNSVNGTLSVKRKNDGKNTNPATNLLPTKNKDNDDFDNDSLINTEQINKDVAKAMANSKKDISKLMNDPKIVEAMNEARKQIVNLQPALDKITTDALQQANVAANYYAAVSPVVEKKSETFIVKGIPMVTIEAKSCNIAVRGWDKAEVSYSVVKVGENRNQAPLDIMANQNASDVSIKVTNTNIATQNGNFFDNSGSVRVEVFVPKKSNLKIVGNGEIRLENVTGAIDLQGADEAVNIRDAGGKLSVGTNDGRIRIIGFSGALDAKTSDGIMNLEGDFQSFNALATNGTIILTLPENANAVLEANAEIKNDGLNLIRDNTGAKSWRIGKGGKIYRMSVGGGKVVVRNASALTPTTL